MIQCFQFSAELLIPAGIARKENYLLKLAQGHYLVSLQVILYAALSDFQQFLTNLTGSTEDCEIQEERE